MYKKLLACLVYGSCIIASEAKSLIKPSEKKMETKKEVPLFESPSEKTSYVKRFLRWAKGE